MDLVATEQPTLDHWSRVDLVDHDPAKTRLSASELRRLASVCGGLRVSLFLPTHERGPAVEQDPIRLRSLLGEAEAALRRRGLSAAEIRGMLEPARALEGDMEFWNHGRRGLALLLAESQAHVLKLPHRVQPRCWVGERYHVTPLLPMTEEDRFAVLALSQSSVRLLVGDREGLRALPSGDIPGCLEDVVGREPDGASLQWHTAGGYAGTQRGAVYHGHGAGHDDRDHERTRFLRRVVAAVPEQLPDRRMPLVLAAVERTVAELRQLGGGLRLTPEAVVGDPSHLSLAQLPAAAWPRATAVLQQPIERAKERITELLGTRRTSVDLGSVLRASHQGRVELLLAASDAPAWGSFDPDRGHLELHGERQPDDDDLVDLAVAYALGHGAEVHALPREQLPASGVLAALHRY